MPLTTTPIPRTLSMLSDWPKISQELTAVIMAYAFAIGATIPAGPF